MLEIPRNNLPAELTSFVGRATDIRTLAGLLITNRLVSLAGPGGVGKSRLATQVALTVVDRFPDGIWFIDLTSTDDGDLVPSVVAEPFAVGDVETGGRRQRTEVVANFLSDKRLLLILDNCEHVLDAVRSLTKTLLSVCLGVRVLATTREILGLDGEVVFRLAPLPVDAEIEGERPDAVRLFLDRASQVRAGYQVDSGGLAVIGEIVRRLDGLPLAIEIAASRTKLLSPRQILDRLADRFRFLEASADQPSRHETIHATIDWSYNLLDGREQAALQRLAVFNGWSLEGAEAVLGVVDAFELLEGLVDKSLVDVVPRGPENRYRILETIRQYALGRLAESGRENEARTEHGSYFLALAEEGDQRLRGHDQAEWVEKIGADHDNIRAALGWALGEGHVEYALRMVAAMGRFWFMQTEWKDALGWFRKVSELSGPEHELLWARAFIKTGGIELITRGAPSDPDAAERAHRILEERGSKSEQAMSLYALAEARSMSTGAEETIRASIRLFQEAGDQWGEAYAKRWLGSKVELLGDARQNIAHHREAVEGFIRLGDRWSAGWLAFDLGFSLLAVGEYVEADQAFDMALGLVADTDERFVVAHATRGKASVAAGLGKPEEARRLFRDAIPMFERIGDQSCVAFSHLYLADVESELGELEMVVSLLGRAIEGFEETRNPGPGVAAALRRLARTVTDDAPELATRFLAAAEGLRMRSAMPSPPEQAIEEKVTAALDHALGSERFQELLSSGEEASYRDLIAEIRLIEGPRTTPEPSLPTESDSRFVWPAAFDDLRRHIMSAWSVEGDLLVQRPLGGKSGALVLAVDLKCQTFSGQAILKLEEAEGAEGELEADRHRLAYRRSPEFAARHLPRIVHSTSYWRTTAVLATIAARGLEFTVPWEESSYPTQLTICRRVSAEILGSWNVDYRLAEAILKPTEVLSGWLDYRLDPHRGRIHGFLDKAGVDPLTPTLNWDGHWYPNPLAFAVGGNVGMNRLGIRPVMGHTHGDLHGFNLLVQETDGALEWFLIDLAFYRPDAFLFFDHAYFELSHLLETRASRPIDRWMSLLAAIGGRETAHGDDIGLVDLAQAMRGEVLAWVDANEPDRVSYMVGQMMLARIAVGLNFTHKRIPDALKQRGFLYAMSSLKDYVRFEGLSWPRTGAILQFG